MFSTIVVYMIEREVREEKINRKLIGLDIVPCISAIFQPKMAG